MTAQEQHGVSVRVANRSDIPEWRAMRAQLYTGLSEAFDVAEMDQILSAEDKACFVLHAHPLANIVGFAEVSLRNVVDGCLSSPVGYLEGIYIDPAHRSHGHARSLLKHAEAWCAGKGCTEMGSDSELHNEDAQRFHRHLGFQETYRVVGFRKALKD